MKSNIKKLLLKLSDIDIKEQHCGIDKVCFYVNNLKTSITNTTHTAHILQIIQSV